jgi:hypothetical protein
VEFYTIHAGAHDQIHCSTPSGFPHCTEGALFEASSNVRAQLNVGVDPAASKSNLDFSNQSLSQEKTLSVKGGDKDGIGHFKARNNTGEIINTMLNTECTGMECKGPYDGGPVAED